MTTYEQISVGLLGIYTLTTAVYTVVTLALWLTTRRSVEEFAKSTDLANRAWVIARCELLGGPDAGKPMHFHLAFDNVGKTPALNIRYAFRVDILEDVSVPLGRLPEFEDERFVLAPDTTTNNFWIKSDPVNAAARTLLYEGPLSVRVYGQVLYSDVSRVPRKTSFAFCSRGLKTWGYAKHGNSIE